MKKIFAALVVAALLSGCASSKTFEGVGSFVGTKDCDGEFSPVACNKLPVR